ncbi:MULTISPECIES: type IV toxin-antitoxin system AbiEi family antitoxin domain-containing protein [Microbacterium]|uniref:DUF559 domain-containing protein n=1 Tax=Microbacterium TaxID=33882 RepID=UPI000D648253|nr:MULTISPECIES: type IV toxin-antitoxin system AbiEi family antitoxin domain-containing protein [Microbacterium]
MPIVVSDAEQVLTRADLLKAGLRPKQITRAVREGRLLRLRRDRYMLAASPSGVDRAVRVGGRLACVSVLVMWGVFVLDASLLHLHLERTMSRLRSPDDPCLPLHAASRRGLVLHWWPLRGDGATLGRVSLFDALVQAVRCQPARAAVATIDSVLHLGLMTWAEVRSVFDALPDRYRVILRLSDGTAESGPETLMRLMLRQEGLRYAAQVRIAGVGRVDFVVEGRLIIECDSRAHHEGWEKQRRDRRRDLAAAGLGYATLRPLAEDIMFNPDEVRIAVRGLARTLRRA